ncbi:unnamed protein product [Chrysoparadoxa australica]
MQCLRPQLVEPPEEPWGCPYCISEDLAPGNAEEAKVSVQRMKKLSSMYLHSPMCSKPPSHSRDGRGQPKNKSRPKPKSKLRGSRSRGKSDKDLWCVEAVEQRGDTRTEGKPGGAFEAFLLDGGERVSVGILPTAVQAAHTADHYTRLLLGSRGPLNYPTQAEAGSRAAQVKELQSLHMNLRQMEEECIEGTEGKPWCVYCQDDPSVVRCLFCACKACHGKQDPDSVLLCDGCDGEYHMYCLRPPLASVPRGEWYCSECKAKGLTKRKRPRSSAMEVEEDLGELSSESPLSDPPSSTSKSRGGRTQAGGTKRASEDETTQNSRNNSNGRKVKRKSNPDQDAAKRQRRRQLPLHETPTDYDLSQIMQLVKEMQHRLLSQGEVELMDKVVGAGHVDHMLRVRQELDEQRAGLLLKIHALERKVADEGTPPQPEPHQSEGMKHSVTQPLALRVG